MPPQQPNDSTRRVIDIAFAMPEGTLRAMEQLTQSMAGMQEYMASVLSGTPEGRAAGVRRAAAATRPGQIPTSSHAFASLPPNMGEMGYVGTRSAAGEGASMPVMPKEPVYSQSGLFGRIHEYRAAGVRGLGMLDREIQRYGARETQQARRRAGYAPGALRNYEESSLGAEEEMFDSSGYGQGPPAGSGGGPSSGASLPGIPGRDPRGVPAPLRALASDPNRFERAQEGFRMPQFGELTVQDKLRMAADYMTRSSLAAYERQYQQGEAQGLTGEQLNAYTQGTAINRGRSGVLLNMAADNATQASVVAGNVRQAFRWGQGMQAQGIESGYAPGGVTNIPGTNIGFRNPLDFFNRGSAFRESINQRMNAQRLRAQGGITGGQASEIVGSLAGLGWTGEQGQNMAFDAVAPLVQQGLNPGVTSQMFDQAIRNGNTSLADLRQTLDDLAPSARAAHMTLTEYQQGLDEFANKQQEMGATYGEGVRTGRNLSTAYGMAPQQIQAFTSSPLVQAIGATKFGALPQEFGALGTAGQAGAIQGGVDQALNAFQGFRNTPVKDASGRIIISGPRRQINMAAQALGVSYEQLQRYQQGRRVAPHILQGNQALDNYAKNANLAHAADGARADQSAKFVDGPSKPGDWVPANPSTPGAVNRGGHWMIKATIGGDAGRYELTGARGALDRQVGGDWRAVQDQMVLTARMETNKGERGKLFEQINKIKAEDDPKKRAAAARGFLSDAAKKVVEDRTDNKVQVGFTGAAAKYFKQVEDKLPKEFRDADAGGRPRSDSAVADSSTNYMDLLKATFGG